MNECDNRTNLQLKYDNLLINVQTQKNIAQKHIAQKLIAQHTWKKNN